MTDHRTSSMLQRVPVILAVTAASYGIQLPPSVQRLSGHGTASSVRVAAPAAMHLPPLRG